MTGRGRRTAAALLAAGLAAPMLGGTIVNSKHDLSSTSPATVRATSENQVCVFCHTPHKPNANVPLWNHANSTQTYTFYQSNYVNTYLGFTTPVAVGSRTKLCLSCHDGTVALGSVYNLGGASGNLGMTGAGPGNTMPGGATNLGTTLADDHPVAYGVDTVKDTELVVPGGADAVKVYGASNEVECTSCHNPHDPQFGKFLVKSNTNAAICTTCHAKTGWSSAVHKTSVVSYTPPSTTTATTVGEWACRNCHEMHTSSGTAGIPLNPYSYLLRKSEENTCFECHGNPPLTGAKNIQALLVKTSRHPTISKSGVHINPETDGTNFTATPDKRHAECRDCHNPHRAQTGNRLSKTTPNNLVSNVLLGAWGVEPTYGGTAWTAPTGYTRQVFTDTVSFKEYELCLKCHSSYAYGASPPSGYTDQSIEFNPNNAAWHPVRGAGSNPYCTSTTTNGNVVTMEAPWNQTANEHDTMFCSDCHGSDVGTDPEGPHGSSTASILQAALVAIQYAAYGNRYGTPLCLKCHKAAVYMGTPTGSRMGEHGAGQTTHSRAPADTGSGGYGGCLVCHGNLTAGVKGTFHGENKQWAATAKTTASPGYRFITNETNFTGWNPGNCWVDNASGCNTNHSRTY